MYTSITASSWNGRQATNGQSNTPSSAYLATRVTATTWGKQDPAGICNTV